MRSIPRSRSLTDFLHHQIASEPAGRRDDNRPHAVGLDPFEQGSKAARMSMGSARLTAAS
jgi:hypothetical protein